MAKGKRSYRQTLFNVRTFPTLEFCVSILGVVRQNVTFLKSGERSHSQITRPHIFKREHVKCVESPK